MMYKVVALAIALDITTGMIKAFKNKEFTSSTMREGLFHKCGSILCVLFGVLVDYAQKTVDLGINAPVGAFLCSYIILMELGSIVENLGTINPKLVPVKIKELFTKLNGKEVF